MKELIIIQERLKAPKNQFNNHGKFNYRSCEDILEGVKPLLKELDCLLTITDSIVNIGNYNYIIAKATITNNEEKYVTVDGIAKEANEQKGMQAAQLTGSTSSYARKYALNGLFAIDDTKDDDTRPPTEEKTNTSSKPTGQEQAKLTNAIEKKRQTGITKVLSIYNTMTVKIPEWETWIKGVQGCTIEQLIDACKKLTAIIKAQQKGDK
jgi:hypothetical protein